MKDLEKENDFRSRNTAFLAGKAPWPRGSRHSGGLRRRWTLVRNQAFRWLRAEILQTVEMVRKRSTDAFVYVTVISHLHPTDPTELGLFCVWFLPLKTYRTFIFVFKLDRTSPSCLGLLVSVKFNPESLGWLKTIRAIRGIYPLSLSHFQWIYI